MKLLKNTYLVYSLCYLAVYASYHNNAGYGKQGAQHVRVSQFVLQLTESFWNMPQLYLKVIRQNIQNVN